MQARGYELTSAERSLSEQREHIERATEELSH